MQRFKRITLVVNTDGVSDALLERAEDVATRNSASITCVTVMARTPTEMTYMFAGLDGGIGPSLEADLTEYHTGRLNEIAERLRGKGLTVDTKLLHGTAFIEIIRHVMADEVQMVIKEAEPSPMPAILRGPDLHLLRKCPCPVWLLNNVTEPCAKRIVAAVDPDPEDKVRDALNREVMDLATTLARQDKARLHVVNAWFLEEESALRSSIVRAADAEVDTLVGHVEEKSRARLDALLADYQEFNDLMQVVHVKGVPADILAEYAQAEEIDTIVMGTVPRTSLAGFFIGNTAETVLNRVGCSVLAVKPEGFVSPVAPLEMA